MINPMSFLLSEQPSKPLELIINADLKTHWSPTEVKTIDYSYCQEDLEQLRNIFVPLAFAESTAFNGFCGQILAAQEEGLKLWLCTQLLDEARHSIALSRYLIQFTCREMLTTSPDRYVVRFYANFDTINNVVDWLFSLMCSEFFIGYAYTEMEKRIPDKAAKHLVNLIIGDEHRHRGFLKTYLNEAFNKERFSLTKERIDFWMKTISLARDSVEGKRKTLQYQGYNYFGIDITEICNNAENDLLQVISSYK